MIDPLSNSLYLFFFWRVQKGGLLLQIHSKLIFKIKYFPMRLAMEGSPQGVNKTGSWKGDNEILRKSLELGKEVCWSQAQSSEENRKSATEELCTVGAAAISLVFFLPILFPAATNLGPTSPELVSWVWINKAQMTHYPLLFLFVLLYWCTLLNELRVAKN